MRNIDVVSVMGRMVAFFARLDRAKIFPLDRDAYEAREALINFMAKVKPVLARYEDGEASFESQLHEQQVSDAIAAFKRIQP